MLQVMKEEGLECRCELPNVTWQHFGYHCENRTHNKSTMQLLDGSFWEWNEDYSKNRDKDSWLAAIGSSSIPYGLLLVVCRRSGESIQFSDTYVPEGYVRAIKRCAIKNGWYGEQSLIESDIRDFVERVYG